MQILIDLIYYSKFKLIAENILDFQIDNLYLIKKLIADSAYCQTNQSKYTYLYLKAPLTPPTDNRKVNSNKK